MSNVQDNAAHTCSYSCDRPECIKAQRDELAAAVAQEAVAEVTDIIGRSGVEIHWLSGPAKIGDLLYAAPVTAAPADTWFADQLAAMDRIVIRDREVGFPTIMTETARTAVAELIGAAECALNFARGVEGMSRNNAEQMAAEVVEQLTAALAHVQANSHGAGDRA